MAYDKELYDNLAAAAASAVRVARGVRPETLDGPSPSADWDPRTVVNHFVLWSAYALERRGRREEIGDDMAERDFTAEPGWQDAYATTFDRALDLWASPETWEGSINEMRAPDIAAMLLLETVLHGWDAAKATGQDYTADPAVGEAVYGLVSQYAGMYREYGGFGPEVPVPADAPALDRALALSGRDPAWSGA